MLVDNIFFGVWTGAQFLIVLIACLYMYATLAHPNDTAFASLKVMRFLVWFGFIMAFVPMLLVNVDVFFHDSN